MTSPVTAFGTPPITSIDCPDDGDDVVADDIRAPVAALLANDAYAFDVVNRNNTWTGDNTFQEPVVLEDGAEVTGGDIELATGVDITFASPRTYTRGPQGIYAVTVSATQWLMPSLGAYEQGTDVTTGSPIIWLMNVPPNSIVTGVSLLVDPPSGHGGVLPNTPPSFQALIVNGATGVYGLIAGSNISDPTPIGSYEASHTFASGVLAGAVGSSEFVVVEVRGEYGGSAVPGLKAYSPVVTFTREKLGEE